MHVQYYLNFKIHKSELYNNYTVIFELENTYVCERNWEISYFNVGTPALSFGP